MVWQMHRTRPLICAAVAAALALPASSPAAVTVGSTLSSPPAAQRQCNTLCTWVQTTANPGAPTGMRSPVSGTVVRWRIREGGSATIPPVALRVVRPAAGGQFLGVGTSATVIPAALAVSTYDTSLPISAGDLIGIDCCDNTFGKYFENDAATTAAFWDPALPDGTGPQAPTNTGNTAVVINADVEPTSTLKVAGTSARRGGKIRLRVVLSNPGSLRVSDKTKLLKRATRQVPAAATTSLALKPTKAARARLKHGSHPKAKLVLAFTPTGGVADKAVVRVKLRA
jgi:hypothetical protein